MSYDLDKLETLVRHINSVQQNCHLLGQRLIKLGEVDLGHLLIGNGHIHDNSKFHGIEWMHLNNEAKEKEPEKFKLAKNQHNKMNCHHPESWVGGIEEMTRLYKAEMICDWHARSSEFGMSIREWVKSQATKKFKFTVQGKVYKDIKGLLDILLDAEFK